MHKGVYGKRTDTQPKSALEIRSNAQALREYAVDRQKESGWRRARILQRLRKI
jgi:hypothetical protein